MELLLDIDIFPLHNCEPTYSFRRGTHLYANFAAGLMRPREHLDRALNAFEKVSRALGVVHAAV